MKSKWFAFGCLTSFLIVVLIIFLSLSGLNKIGKEFTGSKQFSRVNDNSFLHIALNGSIVAYNEYEEGYFNSSETSVHDLVNKITVAAKDEKISGILLEPNFISAGYADLHELMNALEAFRATGKQVITYLDFAMNKDYFLASVSDKIYLNPSASAGIVLTGVGGNVLFYKDLFDKIGIDVTVLSAGKYKGAGETYSRSSFSNPVKQNISKLYDSIYNSVLENIARNRELNKSEIKHIFEQRDQLFINHNAALDYKLVDELFYRDDVIKKYFLKNKLVDYKKYNATLNPVSAYKIAVVYAQGTIAPNMNIPSANNLSAEKLNSVLEDLRLDNSVKAIVLRVNSPGGSALISENITQKISQVKEQKPVIVSMGNVAASGGYYISSLADHIFVDPFTITGSIGVVAMFPNVEGLSDKLGINSEDIGKGKYVHAFDFYKKPSNSDIAAMNKSLQETYLEFKERVSFGRSMSLQEVEQVAQGQVWSSFDAVANGLADEIGILGDAIRKAAELSGTASYQVSYFPKKKSMLQELLKKGFDLDVATKLLESELPEEFRINETKDLLIGIKNHPVQTLMPFRLQP
ncbi:MAG: signal peptide peptidase SppA [Candidatus Cloacimonetes bacterium]|nr:signal peptide peptidase SppA [Candidatus Cloacimonadota bacterium]MCF7815286.1 signal peptide peptidase SppA [Candidatus Cloacimonadota bacterium]MCF7869415.1 signal peptide peptidase SppA [Candidatus Cloacimonadota bacterium]MCF7884809.1 signal peptide peptidase SppA [Candidatus Cloacimonadota bacterium]